MRRTTGLKEIDDAFGGRRKVRLAEYPRQLILRGDRLRKEVRVDDRAERCSAK